MEAPGGSSTSRRSVDERIGGGGPRRVRCAPLSSHCAQSYPDSAIEGLGSCACGLSRLLLGFLRASLAYVRPSVREGRKNSTYYPGYRWTLIRRRAVIETGVEETHIQIFTGFFLH